VRVRVASGDTPAMQHTHAEGWRCDVRVWGRSAGGDTVSWRTGANGVGKAHVKLGEGGRRKNERALVAYGRLGVQTVAVAVRDLGGLGLSVAAPTTSRRQRSCCFTVALGRGGRTSRDTVDRGSGLTL